MAADRGDRAGAAGLDLERRLMRTPALAMFVVAALALLIGAGVALRSAAFLAGARPAAPRAVVDRGRDARPARRQRLPSGSHEAA